MKKLTLLFFVILLFTNCTKEVGKEVYNLTFSFNTGERITTECLVYEKSKKYKSSTAEQVLVSESAGKIIYVEAQFYTTEIWGMSFLKTEADYLAGISYFHAPCANASFAAGQNVDIQGVMDMYGSYGRKWRKYTVEEGTFTFQWTNAADYGETNKVLTGTWTLKRK